MADTVGSPPGASSSSAPAAPSASAQPSATFNDADVMFAQMMIPHHEQAVEMADLAATRASDPEVKELATKIKAAQDPEIQTMKGWLTGHRRHRLRDGGRRAPGGRRQPVHLSLPQSRPHG